MKLTKKGIWAIVGTSVVAVSAIVVPTSIALTTSQTATPLQTTNSPPATESGPADGGGAPAVTASPGNQGSQPSPTATEAEVNEDSVDYSHDAAKNLTFPWGDPRRFPAPPLDFPGYRAAQYDAGAYDSQRSDFDRFTTQLGDSKAVFSFTYQPLNQGEKLLRVKYGVNVVKGSTEPLLGFFTRQAERSPMAQKRLRPWLAALTAGLSTTDTVLKKTPQQSLIQRTLTNKATRLRPTKSKRWAWAAGSGPSTRRSSTLTTTTTKE